ncbi:MAG TPA: T9SS type A sorting domain-containing protein [Chitinophagales bacterium]|nr:T9SS type A sorting domain-containing protein [Chitinophagales bacterium]
MKYLHFVIVFIFSLPCFAQTSYILAGDSFNTRYTDYIPDAQPPLTYKSDYPADWGETITGSMMIDVDGDGIRDLIFTHHQKWGGYTFKRNELLGLNGSLISYNNVLGYSVGPGPDSSLYKIANKFIYRDTIDIYRTNWDDTVLSYEYIHAGSDNSINGNFLPSDSPAFFGIMIPKDNDTLFAWVQFQNRGCCLSGGNDYLSPIIMDFACSGTPGNHVLLGYTSVVDGIKDREISVYPNPFTNDLFIELNSPGIKSVQYSICNMLGQVVCTKTGKPNAIEKIDVGQIPKGVYSLNVVIDSELIEKKIVRQ